jgi:hypothetical protein
MVSVDTLSRDTIPLNEKNRRTENLVAAAVVISCGVASPSETVYIVRNGHEKLFSLYTVPNGLNIFMK